MEQSEEAQLQQAQQQQHYTQDELRQKLAHQKCLEHVDIALRVNTIQYILTAIGELASSSPSATSSSSSTNHLISNPAAPKDWRDAAATTSTTPLFAFAKRNKGEATKVIDSEASIAKSSFDNETLEQTEGRLASSADNIVPVHCLPSAYSSKSGAGYIWSNTPWAQRGDIVIFEDLLTTPHDVELSMRHELIHAFDDKRAFIDPSNCLQHACSEVRAARLSGDCFYGEEVKRGHLGVGYGGQKCVRRRAELSVEQNPMCRGYGKRSVDVVFPRCYVDYEPYVNPLYQAGDYIPPF